MHSYSCMRGPGGNMGPKLLKLSGCASTGRSIGSSFLTRPCCVIFIDASIMSPISTKNSTSGNTTKNQEMEAYPVRHIKFRIQVQNRM